MRIHMLLLCLLVAACGKQADVQFGGAISNGPDASDVVTNKPLVTPPSYDDLPEPSNNPTVVETPPLEDTTTLDTTTLDGA